MSRNQQRRVGGKRCRSDEWHLDARDMQNVNNVSFERYYKNNVVPEGEWEAFMNSLRSSLPMAVRVTRNTPHAEAVYTFVHDRLHAVFEVHELPFLKREGAKALQCAVSRGDLKRSAEHTTVKRTIAALNEGGYVTRQEAVSMLPPVLLQVQPGHRVLDMCAAPGSKTSQLLEALLSCDDKTGIVVANDVNTSRLDVLHHQTNRIAGAHPHLIITHYDATRFPILPSQDKFDRVLCDVMCSGDGTLRKSVDMWPRWNTLQGADLHTLQCRVLLRGMASVRQGGIVVYSTCSLNPVENEAVVSECLHQAQGCFELIDPEPHLSGLKASPGMTRWSMTTKDLSATLHTYAEAEAYMATQEGRCFQYRASMFANEERLQAQKIQYARRVLPHAQDTGGFFLTAMRCMTELPEPPSVLADSAADVHLKPLSDALKSSVQQALGLPDDFAYDCLRVRNESTRVQKLYCAHPAVLEFYPKLGSRVVHVGAKVIESYVKHSNDRLRLCADGVTSIVPLLPTSFVVPVDAQLLLDLANETPMEYAVFCERAHISMDAIPMYSFVLRCELEPGGAVFVAAEKSTRVGKLVAKVHDWQLILSKLTLGLPLAQPNGAPLQAHGEGNTVGT